LIVTAILVPHCQPSSWLLAAILDVQGQSIQLTDNHVLLDSDITTCRKPLAKVRGYTYAKIEHVRESSYFWLSRRLVVVVVLLAGALSTKASPSFQNGSG